MSIPEVTPVKIDFITLSRSDYASIKPVINESIKHPALQAGIIAGGSHLLNRFGKSIDLIQKDFRINEIIDFLNEQDEGAVAFSFAYAKAVKGFVDVLSRRNPDLIFIVGDRWELLAVATAASQLRIPIAHHSGGDITQGSADNQTRYAVSALSHLHFVSLEEHAQRLILMGEEPWRIVVTGEPALTQIYDNAKKPVDVYALYNLDKKIRFILATFHPTTYDVLGFNEQVELYSKILLSIDLPVLLTAPNPDQGSQIFYNVLKKLALHKENIHFIEHMGIDTYYSAMKSASLMIGNSSSGLWEAPSYQLPVVNIGSREDGRLRAMNVIDVELDYNKIMNAIALGLSDTFKNSLSTLQNPYVHSGTNTLIINTLLKMANKKDLLYKKFVDPIKVVNVL